MKINSTNLSGTDDFIRFLQKTNPNQEPLTIERLRSYPGCESYTDEQAKDILNLLNELATIILEISPSKNIICIDNQYIVNSNSQPGDETIPLFSNEKNKAA